MCVFLFGFPFAALFLVLMGLVTGDAIPQVTRAQLPMVLVAALAQIFATALMLAAMRTKSFVVAIAYTKTEPVMVALFGLVILHEHLSLHLGAAIGLATLGVLLTAWPKEGGGFSWQGLAYGLGSAALFAVFRAGGFGPPSTPCPREGSASARPRFSRWGCCCKRFC